MLSRYVEGYESLFEMRKKTGLGIEFDWVSKDQMRRELHHNLTLWLTFFFFFLGGVLYMHGVCFFKKYTGN